MSSGHYCDGCAQAYYKCVCNKPQEKVKEQTIKMNERFKQLAEQAGIEFVYDPTETPMRAFVECWEDEMQKFAELIVRECAELIDNKVTITAAQTYDEVFVARYDTKEQCAQQIKEHFGVEE